MFIKKTSNMILKMRVKRLMIMHKRRSYNNHHDRELFICQEAHEI